MSKVGQWNVTSLSIKLFKKMQYNLLSGRKVNFDKLGSFHLVVSLDFRWHFLLNECIFSF